MNEGRMIDDNEDYAFYQSGLSADGCLEKLDDYTRKAIKKYGEILLEKQKEDFVKGCCYCCEPVGIANVELEKERDCFKEMFEMQTKLVVDLEMQLIKMEEQLKNDLERTTTTSL